MTPVFIEFMLRCYYSADVPKSYPLRQWTSPALGDVKTLAVRQELVVQETWRPTEKGRAYVKALCAVSLPKTHYYCELTYQEEIHQ